LKIIDLKPYGGGIYTEIIECKDKEILFETYKNIANKYYYCIMIYDIDRKTSVEIYRYEVSENEKYSQYTHLIGDKIFIIKTHNPRQLEVDKIDRKNGENKKTYYINTKEDITSIPIFINEQYIIFYTDIDLESSEYKRYIDKGFKECDYAIYLYDLYKNKIYFIKDFRLIEGMGVEHGRINKFPIFSYKDEDYIVFNETYMDDWEYEDIYQCVLKKGLDNTNFYPETLFYIRLSEFTESIKVGEENIPFKIIKKKKLDGWVRYLYSDNNYIYYRDKDFSTQKEKIIRINKLNLESEIVKEIDHSKIKGRIMYDRFSETLRIYAEYSIEDEDKIIAELEGLYNCNYNIKVDFDKFPARYRGSYTYFESIEDRFIIASGWYEDEKEDYFDIYCIKDLKKGRNSEFIGKCRVYRDMLIIYESTLL